MKKYLIAGVIVVAIIVVGGIYLSRRGAVPQSQTAGIEINNPWAEVITTQIKNTPAGGTQSQELQTGDAVLSGSTVQADQSGFGNVYFPDGSVARVDSGTQFTVENTEYNSENGGLIVKIRLTAGRIWSKVFGLATPDSTWEVKTSNAVATIRGTAMGVEYENGQTLILGSEDKVSVSVVDPKTGSVVKESAVTVTPGDEVIIKDSDVPAIAQNKIVLAASPAPAELLNQDWVRRDTEADTKIDETENALKAEGLTGKALRDAFKQALEQPFLKQIETRQLRVNTTTPPPTTPTTETKIQSQTNTNAPTPTGGVPSVTNVSAVPESLAITTDNPLTNVTEDDTITFKAILTLSDGTTKDITASASWQVVGMIGSVSNSGVFTAKLDPSVAEYGQASGAVVTSWKDPDMGAELYGKTAIFTVNAYVPTATGTPQG